MAVADLDARALKILLDTYWTSKGWRGDRDEMVSPADRAYAESHRMMFERPTLSHDELVEHIVAARTALSQRAVVQAFFASLSTRRLDLRSGLGSFARASHLKRHAFQPDINGTWCEVCQGVNHNTAIDLDVLNFERHKWGGVRHSWPTYQYLDLRELAHALPATPEPEDLKIWAAILKAIAKTPKADGPGKLEKRLADVLPSTKQERHQLLELLAMAGVLVAKQERSSPGEWMWVGMWRGADGYDRAQAQKLLETAATKLTPNRASPTKPAGRSSPKQPTRRASPKQRATKGATRKAGARRSAVARA